MRLSNRVACDWIQRRPFRMQKALKEKKYSSEKLHNPVAALKADGSSAINIQFILFT